MRKCGAYDCEASVWSIHIEQIGRFTHSVNIENINNCIAKLKCFFFKRKRRVQRQNFIFEILKLMVNKHKRKDDFESPFSCNND